MAERKRAATATPFLPRGRLSGPMPWVIAIMMFLTVLAAAAGIGLIRGAVALGDQLASRVTVQVPQSDPVVRADHLSTLTKMLTASPGVLAVNVVPETELRAMLGQYLGKDSIDSSLPVPALIDVDMMTAPDARTLEELRAAVTAAVPAARIMPHADWLQPIQRVITSFAGLAIMVMVMMALANAAVVVLAARSALSSHWGTIEVLHLIGATDDQIARQFQIRLARDALLGGLIGLLAAGVVIVIMAWQFRSVDNELLRAMNLGWTGWTLLLLPALGGAIAAGAARRTLMGALKRLR